MKVGHRVWLELDSRFFGKGPAELLRRVDQTHSLRQAAQQLDLSYTKAFTIIKLAEQQLGYPLLVRTIGGESGGGSQLSEQGKQLLANYDVIEAAVSKKARESFALLEQQQLMVAVERYRDRQLISVIGGGGKTTLVNYLTQYRAQRGPTLLSCTTAMYRPQDMPVDYGVITSVGNPIALFSHLVNENKVKGVEPEVLDDLKAQGRFASIIIEADGSKGRPFKAYGANEPPIPTTSDLVMLVLGIDGFGEPIETIVHRPEIFTEATGATADEPLTVAHFLAYFTHPRGSLKNTPDCPVVVILNRKDQLKDRSILAPLIQGLFQEQRVEEVWLCELADGRLEQVFTRPVR